MTLVSIIIPSYNRQEYIAETLDSVLSQTYQDWECIIVDDGSTDNTEAVVKTYVQKDSRFSFYKRPETMKKGANSCRNYGFQQAKGSYVKFLDSDDLLTSDCLEKQFKILEDNHKIQVCLSYGRYFKDTTKDLEEFWSRNQEYPDYLLGHITNQIRWQTADPLWRKSFFTNPPFREGLMNSQEWLMHGEALLRLKRDEIYNLKETFTLIRRGNVKISSQQNLRFYKNQTLAAKSLLYKLLINRHTDLKYYIPITKQIIGQYYMRLRIILGK